jgi:nicotinamide mononucleotide transporter
MSEISLQLLFDNLRRTSVAEWVAVATGVVYITLIIRRNRWGWLFGGISSLIAAVLCAQSRLPMQALLQASYVAGAVYGWCSWKPEAAQQHISHWKPQWHLVMLVLCAAASFGLRPLLANESAFPFLDSLVACFGLFATWQVARVYIENWVYWLVVDAISMYLYLSQGLVLMAGLFIIYFVMSVTGFVSWWRTRAAQRAAEQAA